MIKYYEPMNSIIIEPFDFTFYRSFHFGFFICTNKFTKILTNSQQKCIKT